MVKPSPWPWKIQDNEGRSYKVVAMDGTVVAYMHYPANVEHGVNCRLVERAAELFDKFKQQQTIMEVMVRQCGREPARDAFLLSAKALIADLEIRPPPKGPPGEGGRAGVG